MLNAFLKNLSSVNFAVDGTSADNFERDAG
jgi:hypothetical protein